MSVLLRAFVGFAFALVPTLSGAQEQRPDSTGTGFFVNNAGWVLTNAHVVQGCSTVTVRGIGRAFDVRVDETNDLAALRTNSGLKSLPIKISTDAPRLGEDVVALGYPLSGLLSDAVKMTTGNISSLAGIGNDARFLQVSVPIQPGSSGGPLVDGSARLVGVMSGSLKKALSDQIGFNTQNVNFAIKAAIVTQFLSSNSISYSVEIEKRDGLSAADIAERISASTVQVICRGRSEPPESGVANSGPSVSSSTMVNIRGYDALGFDYEMHRGMSFSTCKRACAKDRTCQALTYNRRHNVCFLKSDVVVLVKNTDAIAAFPEAKSAEILVSNMTIQTNTDSPGGDYRRIRKSTFVQCVVECLVDGNCRGFSYVSKRDDCWLKAYIGQINRKRGVEFGRK